MGSAIYTVQTFISAVHEPTLAVLLARSILRPLIEAFSGLLSKHSQASSRSILRPPIGAQRVTKKNAGNGRLASDDGRLINLVGKNTVLVGKGDRICIHSPGGGGFGGVDGEESSSSSSSSVVAAVPSAALMRTGGSLNQYTLNQESV